MADNFLQGFQVGANTGASIIDRRQRAAEFRYRQESDAEDRELRIQELKSAQALRMVQERAAAQAMAMKMEEFSRETQYRADMQKAVGAAQLASSEVIPIPGLGVMPNPNPMPQDRAIMQFVLPVLGKYEPEKVVPAMQDMALRRAQSMPRPRTEEQIAADIALKEQREATRDLSRARITDIENSNDQTFQPKIVDVPTGVPGESVKFGMTSPKSGIFLPGSQPEFITTEDGQKLFRSGPTSKWQPVPANIADRQTKQKVLAFALEKAPELLEEGPDGMPSLPAGKFEEAARRAGISPTTKAQLEQKEISAENVVNIARQVLPLLTRENLGVEGNFRRLIVNKGLAQVFPNMKIGSQSELVTELRLLKGELFKTLRSDSNITGPEMERIELSAPSAESLLTSPQEAKSQLAALMTRAATISRESAIKRGKPINDMFLQRDEIRERIKSGDITAKQGAELWNNNILNLAETIRSQVTQ